MIGAALGLGIAFSIARQYLVSMALLLSVSVTSWGVVNSLWSDQIARYGRDRSEIILYYPPLAFSNLAMAAVIVVGVVALAKAPSRSK